MHDQTELLVDLAVCLSAALVLGFITNWLRLSPIVGYLLAGVAVGSQTPGVVADQATTAQFAEIGVILLMFGVGLHFHLGDLLAVRRVAVPGALAQVAVASTLGMLAAVGAGSTWAAGAVLGMAISVASTVVLIRVLTDNKVLDTEQGHIAIGWLIVEDLITVFLLVMLPAASTALAAGGDAIGMVLTALGVAIVKVIALAVAVLWGGRIIIPRVLQQVARTRTRELFTLTILALALVIATGASAMFGVSMALGAFLAGMVVGQSAVSHQAAADALPMRDAFAVLFFVSVGMQLDAAVILANPRLFVLLLGVILIAKPVVAWGLVWTLGYSVRTALTVAIALARIGEFSFILAGLAADLKLLAPEGESLLVAAAILTISLNPLLFRAVAPLEAWARRQPRLWKLLSHRSETKALKRPRAAMAPAANATVRRAIVIGYGPVGRTASAIMKEFGIEPVIVDLNVDTITNLTARGELAVYGDAAQREILKDAGIATAQYLLITIPELQTRTVIILVARELNADIKVFVRARYLEERAWLEEIGASEVCFEEAEAAMGLAAILLREVGADEDRIALELRRTRSRLAFQTLPDPSERSPASQAANR
jgi:CPA2 family monovalent cation:H+ antiporter-2